MIWGNKATMNHSLCFAGPIVKLTWSSRTLNLWSKSQTDSPRLCWISFNSVIHCDFDLGFLNSLIIVALISSKTWFWVLEKFINQVKDRSLKEVTSCALLTSWSKMFLVVHTASHKNKNCYGSSDLVPLNTGSLISSIIWAIVDWGGGELTGVDWPATRILGLGLLPDCDRFSGVIDLHCGVIGGFLTKGASSIQGILVYTRYSSLGYRILGFSCIFYRFAANHFARRSYFHFQT